jgi:agmatine deiminase
VRRVRAEWEPHSAILLAFPHEETDWAGEGLQNCYAPFIRIIQAIAYSQPVYVLCRSKKDIQHLFCSKTNICFIETEYNDTWIRDYGPITMEIDGNPLLLDFVFDGWGGKFGSSLDNSVNKKLHSAGYFGNIPMQSVDFVLEGGSIESDGEGTVLTTSGCLCNRNRNGGLTKGQLEKKLEEFLGAKRVLWLDHGYLAGDDTDGHVDMLARFVSPDSIVYVKCEDPADEHFQELQLMEKELKKFRTKGGKGYRLIPLPMAPASYDDSGRRLPATYANFLITNKALLYPTYGDRTRDRRAGTIFKNIFPGREVIPIPCTRLISQGGSLHCSTMQIDTNHDNPKAEAVNIFTRSCEILRNSRLRTGKK